MIYEFDNKCYICRRTDDDLDREINLPFIEEYNPTALENKIETLNNGIKYYFNQAIEFLNELSNSLEGNEFIEFKLKTILSDFEAFEEKIPNLRKLLIFARSIDKYGDIKFDPKMSLKGIQREINNIIRFIEQGIIPHPFSLLFEIEYLPETFTRGIYDEEFESIEDYLSEPSEDYDDYDEDEYDEDEYDYDTISELIKVEGLNSFFKILEKRLIKSLQIPFNNRKKIFTLLKEKNDHLKLLKYKPALNVKNRYYEIKGSEYDFDKDDGIKDDKVPSIANIDLRIYTCDICDKLIEKISSY